MRHLWYHAVRRRQVRRGRELLPGAVCDAAATIGRLATAPRPALGWFSRWVAWLTTPFKFIGISGWEDTGCSAEASGAPVRDAQHSTDGFWTIDVRLSSFVIGGVSAEAGRFVRVEVEPGTRARDVCAARSIRKGELLLFGGPVVVDTDGEGFLEVHPDREFEAPPEPAAVHVSRG